MFLLLVYIFQLNRFVTFYITLSAIFRCFNTFVMSTAWLNKKKCNILHCLFLCIADI